MGFVAILKLVLPAVLQAIPVIIQLVQPVSEAAIAAEAQHGSGTGELKKKLVLDAARVAAMEKNISDPDAVVAAVSTGIDTAIAVAKLVQERHGSAAPVKLN